MEDDIVRAAGLSGRSGFDGLAVLSFDGDKIDVAEDVVRLPGNDGIGQPFMTWLRDTHPNDVDLMLDSDDRPRLSPTSIRLWRFHTRGVRALRWHPGPRAADSDQRDLCGGHGRRWAQPCRRHVRRRTATWADRGRPAGGRRRPDACTAADRALPADVRPAVHTPRPAGRGDRPRATRDGFGTTGPNIGDRDLDRSPMAAPVMRLQLARAELEPRAAQSR